MDLVPANDEGIAAASEALRRGEIVAYPTESVYGLGADPKSPEALERLYATKARDPENPVLLCVANMDQLEAVAAQVSPGARRHADRFWPGPLSMLFPPREGLPESLSGPSAKLCVRWTSHPIAAALCEAFGGAITSTSANRSGEAPARAPEDIALEGVALCIDAGELEEAPVSTVFDPDTGQVLREGAIPRSKLET